MNGYLAIEFLKPIYGGAKDAVPASGDRPAVAAVPEHVVDYQVLGTGWQHIVEGECKAVLDDGGNAVAAPGEYRLTDGMNFKTPAFAKAG